MTEAAHSAVLGAKVSIPRVEPGDAVFWHPDIVHALEERNRGETLSASIYIPCTPACPKNAQYLRRQREAFQRGDSPPDFPPLHRERDFPGRATAENLQGAARWQVGLEPPPAEEIEALSDAERDLLDACDGQLFRG